MPCRCRDEGIVDAVIQPPVKWVSSNKSDGYVQKPTTRKSARAAILSHVDSLAGEFEAYRRDYATIFYRNGRG